MDEKLTAAIKNMSFEELKGLQQNARTRNALAEDLVAAIKARGIELGRNLVVTGAALDLTDLTAAEKKILRAASEYASVKKLLGTNSQRTINQIRDKGLIEAAEISVMRSKPTQGYETLADEDLAELSYERIVVDHPDEFSTRAQWYARRRLGLKAATERPPPKSVLAAQRRTVALLGWLQRKAEAGDGILGAFSNADAAAALGMTQLQNEGRAFGNIISRIDFACYRLGLPPLGLAVTVPFKNAWQSEGSWKFPIGAMADAAKSYRWRPYDFARILSETEAFPGLAHFLWKGEPVAPVRSWAEGLADVLGQGEPPPASAGAVPPEPSSRNPDWSREEHILGLDLYVRLRGTSYPDEHPEVVRLSQHLRILARLRAVSGLPNFRNANSISMKMLNFRRLDPDYPGVGLQSGAAGEEAVWQEYASNTTALSAAVRPIMAEILAARDDDVMADIIPKPAMDGQYWVFVNNPKMWALDRFLETGRTEDRWGVNPHDQTKFYPGQLGFIRVGTDGRSDVARQGRPKLVSGIYALVEVASVVFPGTGAADEFWAADHKREAGWPTVRLRYLRNYLDRPLPMERLRQDLPHISGSLLNGRQISSFALPQADFRAVLALLNEDVEYLPDPVPPKADTIEELVAAESNFVNASPEIKVRVSKTIERGKIGNLVKEVNGYRCQLCEAMGHNSLGFKTKHGLHYVEAHHVMPVSTKQIGVLSATNIMTLCANHHREIHYGAIDVTITTDHFHVALDGVSHKIAKTSVHVPALQTTTDG